MLLTLTFPYTTLAPISELLELLWVSKNILVKHFKSFAMISPRSVHLLKVRYLHTYDLCFIPDLFFVARRQQMQRDSWVCIPNDILHRPRLRPPVEGAIALLHASVLETYIHDLFCAC